MISCCDNCVDICCGSHCKNLLIPKTHFCDFLLMIVLFKKFVYKYCRIIFIANRFLQRIHVQSSQLVISFLLKVRRNSIYDNKHIGYMYYLLAKEF